MRIPWAAVRTSPDWCPQGHFLPDIPYPTFSAGRDPIPEGTQIVYLGADGKGPPIVAALVVNLEEDVHRAH